MFSPQEWMNRVGDFQPIATEPGDLFAPYLTGPYDAFFACYLRELLHDRVSLGEAVPSDLFVLSIGESPSRRATKIGGLPYFPHDEPWPTTVDGRPLPFLAQFDFAESADLTAGVFSNVLLLFADLDLREGLAMRWVKDVPADRLVNADDLPVGSPSRTFYGTRWRTVNYPDWEPLNGESWTDFELEDSRRLYNIYFAFELLGMQISRRPFTPPGCRVVNEGEHILCMLPAIVPTPNQPYPFLNHAAELAMEQIEGYSLPLAPLPHDADSFGLLYIIVTSDGSLRWAFHQL